MDAVKQRLEQLDKDIAKATADADQAWDAYQRETNPRQEAKLRERWQQLQDDKKELLAERKALAAQLTGPGAPSSAIDVSQDMRRFAEWAATSREEDEADDWLTLPEDVFFLGLPQLGSSLYIRAAYRKLADVLEEFRASGKLHVVISGNPGLGKSCFAIWMLVRWLRKRLNVLWHSPNNEFFLFKDGKVAELTLAEADRVLRDQYEDVRYIVDGATPRLSLSAVQSFVAHSPDSSKYKDYMKLNKAAGAPLYMPFWDEQELNIVRQRMHPAMSEWQMQQLIARRGAVPRYVLEKGLWQETDEWMEEAVADLKWEDIVNAVPGSSRASHRIAAIHPKKWQEGNFAKYELKVLSVAVRDAATKKLLDTVTGGLAHLMILVNKSAAGLAADLGSCVEESIVHAVLQKGGSWWLRECPPKYTKSPLPSGKNAKLQAATGASAVSSGMQLPSSSDRGQESLSNSASSQADGQEDDCHSVEASGLSEQSKLMSNAGESDAVSGSTSSGSSSPERARRFSLEKLPVSYFTTPEELRSLDPGDTYVQPRFPNYPAIDALTIVGSKVYLFQVTRNTRHKINAELCKVLAYLPAHLEVEWVWVMPPEIWSGKAFNVKTVPTLAQAGFSEEELEQIDVRLVEARLQALQTQYKMAVLQLRTDKQPAEEKDAEEELKEASQEQHVPVTDESAEAGSVRTGTEGAAKEQGATGNIADSREAAGSTRGKRSAGRTSAVLVQTSADRSIMGRHVQVSRRNHARMPAMPQLLHLRARIPRPSASYCLHPSLL